jgi:hypothetical protein
MAIAALELPEQDRARLNATLAWVSRAARPKRGLADKKRRLLEQFDDPGLHRTSLTLPWRVMAAARVTTSLSTLPLQFCSAD